MGIKEIEVLRQDLDLVSPSEVLNGTEAAFAKYRGQITSGDELRFSPRTAHDGPALRAAIGRVINTDPTAGATREEVMKAESMLRVLRALDQAVSNIHRQASLTARY